MACAESWPCSCAPPTTPPTPPTDDAIDIDDIDTSDEPLLMSVKAVERFDMQDVGRISLATLSPASLEAASVPPSGFASSPSESELLDSSTDAEAEASEPRCERRTVCSAATLALGAGAALPLSTILFLRSAGEPIGSDGIPSTSSGGGGIAIMSPSSSTKICAARACCAAQRWFSSERMTG